MSARFTFLFALVLHVHHLIPSMAMAETVSIRADQWLPFNGMPDSSDPGYMIELADIILSDHGLTMDYKPMLWLRSLEAVRKGKIDCVVGAFIDDAPDFIFPEESWGYSVDTFYVKNDSTWNYDGIESLRDVKLGIIGGYAYSPELDVYIEKYRSTAKIHSINTNNALENHIKMLANGRVDVVVEIDVVMEAKLEKMGASDKIRTAGTTQNPGNLYIACSPVKDSSKKYAQLFSAGIQKLRLSGELSVILAKYGLQDWK
jgi:polar amino acid transport system substrate-binding protein|tara:strand:+ start:936 stop:1712 length:777 start_codon:yes stop_codon:yes gene_type:complete